MRTFPRLLALSMLLTAGAADANEGITGYSGKPYNGLPGDTCKTNCHGGSGAAPTLNINVPATIEAGKTGDVTVMVDGTRQRTSMNAAFTDGVKATAGQNTTVPFPIETPGEVGAVVQNGADGTYKFSFVAPNRNGPITLWVAGMSASGAGSTGDGVAAVTRTITVTGATTTPPPPGDAGTTTSSSGSSGSPRAGGSTTTDGDGGSSSSGGTGSSVGGGSEGDDDGAGSKSPGGRRAGATTDGDGCAAASGRTSHPGAGAVALGLVVVVLGRRRRRQRAS